MDPERKKELATFSKKIGIGDIDLIFLNQALTHKSFVNEAKFIKKSIDPSAASNQRLEFLGDAVLGMVIATALYRQFPNDNEGKLTKKKSMAVCEPTLAEVGKRLDIGRYLILGKGEMRTGGVSKSSNVADALEAIIGSIYLGLGFPSAENFILTHWKPYLADGKTAQFSIDHKSILQEMLVKQNNTRPEYRVLGTSGPEHNKTFEVGLFINGECTAVAKAQSRKKAEQKAALEYLSLHRGLSSS